MNDCIFCRIASGDIPATIVKRSQDAVAFVEANPTASVTFDGELVAGTQLDGNIELSLIPDQRTYKYVYVDERPVLVDANTRTIVWVG